MPRCCGGNTATLIQASGGIIVDGTGTAQDPYVIGADISLVVTDTTVFNLTLDGAGSLADPWDLSVAFASTAKLDDLPDVNAPAPTNTQVLGWDSSTSKWTPRAPTTAASGSVDTDTTLTGDGSGGDPLAVNVDPDGYLDGGAAGLGLSDPGLASIIQHFGNDLSRSALLVAPSLNQVTMLDDHPGQQDYWTGAAWRPVNNGVIRDFGTEFMAMSGPYVDGVQLTQLVRQVTATTDPDGVFDVFTVTDLAGRAGVLSVSFQETGVVPFKAVLNGAVDHVTGTAYRLDDGTAYGTQAITGIVTAFVY